MHSEAAGSPTEAPSMIRIAALHVSAQKTVGWSQERLQSDAHISHHAGA